MRMMIAFRVKYDVILCCADLREAALIEEGQIFI